MTVGGAKKSAERRIFERVAMRFPAKFNHLFDDFGNKVFVMNLSAQGANILSNEPLYKEQNVSLQVQIPGASSMEISGTVMWVRPKSDLWDAGIKFHKIDLVGISRLYKYADSSTVV